MAVMTSSVNCLILDNEIRRRFICCTRGYTSGQTHQQTGEGSLYPYQDMESKTKKISNEGIDPWWYEYPYLYSSQRHHCPPSIKIFFGHQRHDKDGSLTGHAHWMAVLYLVGHYECMWGTKGFWRSTPKEPMNWTKKKGLHHLLLQFDLLAKELQRSGSRTSIVYQNLWPKGEFCY